MFQISSDFLTLTADPAVLVRQDRLFFANSPALSLLGADCVGKRLQAVFGAEFSGIQASSFLGDISLPSGRYIARVTTQDGVKAIFLSPHDAPSAVLSESLIYSLRSSLMNIGVATELARQQAELLGSEELLAQLSSLTQSYYRIRRVIDNVSLIREIHSGTQLLYPRSFDLRRLLRQLSEGISFFLPDVRLLVANGAPVLITADLGLIEQLLFNLISNALMHASGFTRISMQIIESAESVIISVDDDGCGIPPDKLYSALDRFRHGFDMNELGRGAGLGLTVVSSIARLHGGTLMLESRPAIGTTVRVSLARSSSIPLCDSVESLSPSSTNILVGLAECLPSRCFSEKYMD